MPAEGRGLSSEPTSEAERDRRLGNLTTPISVQGLRTTLHAKAKEEPDFRFYVLYDKICRMDVLELWRLVQAGGATRPLRRGDGANRSRERDEGAGVVERSR
jgi:hypothetical protein